MIRELCEDAQVLQEWTQRLGVPYRGQRLAGASLEVFLRLLQRRRDNTSSRRAALLAEQDGMCKLCGAPITAQTCELDHIVPVRQAYQGQALELQALCFECHKVKTSMEGNHSTTLESRFCRYVYQNYAASPRLPPLICQLQKWDAERPCEGIDVCRCRKNGLANARFPIPVFCPLDCIVPAGEGELVDLTYVDLPFDGRRGLLDRLPYVGRGWYSKPACAEMLDSGLAQWRHFRWSLEATAHVDQRWLEQALQTMEEAWPEGEEHMAKLSINALVGLARNLDLVYSMRTSNHQVDGEGCSWRQTFTDAAGRMHWDHVFVTELLSNSSYRPVHDFIMGAEYTAVARVRRALAEVPKRYLKCLKTDCLVMQDVPKKHRSAIERLLRLSHRDGTPVYRCEPTEGLRGQCREPRMEAEPIKEKPAWRRVEDPLTHCMEGESLLLTGYPGTGKTHLARKIVEALRELGDTVNIITKTHAAVQNVGLGAQTVDHWVRRNVRSGRCSATWLVIEELTQLDTPLWADIACLSMNTSMRFLLLGDFRQLPAVLDSFAGAEVQGAEGQPIAARPGGGLVPRALGALALRRGGLLLPSVAESGRGRAGASARSRADGPAALPAEGRAGGLPGHLPRQATADQRARESQASAGGCAAGAVRRAGDGGNQCAPNHEGVAGPAACGRWRQSAEGRLRHRQRSGRASHAGKRAELRAPGAAEAHPPLQRHHLRFRAGPDP